MEALKECELREIFKEFDKNGDGKINRQELEVRFVVLPFLLVPKQNVRCSVCEGI